MSEITKKLKNDQNTLRTNKKKKDQMTLKLKKKTKITIKPKK